MEIDKLRVAEYLYGLNPIRCGEFCAQNGIDMVEVTPSTFEEPVQVYDCLVQLMSAGINLAVLFDNVDVWSIYLHSISAPRFHSAIDLMLCSGSPANLILYFRACYRFGYPAIDDTNFDALEILYIQAYPGLSFLQEQTYDDDKYPPLVLDALKLSGSKTTARVPSRNTTATVMNQKEYEDLNSEKSTSIRPVMTSGEAFEFWKNAPMCRVHFSLKIDGVNTKVMFSSEGEGLQLALSRGRATDSIDYTEAIRRVLEYQGVDTTRLKGRISGESFVPLGHLPTIQRLYQEKDYKTPKSTAMAMLRASDKFAAQDYKYLSFYAFDYEGHKPDVAYRMMEELGLSVPPYLEFDGEEIPRSSLDDFDAWMDENVLTPLWNKGAEIGIGSDGIVMYLLADINTERRDKYSDSNIAIKYGYWAASTYTAVVEEIIFEQRRVKASIVLRIKPTVMRDKNTATRVGVGSPDILIKDNVRVGDTIEFARESEAYNVYLRKVEPTE